MNEKAAAQPASPSHQQYSTYSSNRSRARFCEARVPLASLSFPLSATRLPLVVLAGFELLLVPMLPPLVRLPPPVRPLDLTRTGVPCLGGDASLPRLAASARLKSCMWCTRRTHGTDRQSKRVNPLGQRIRELEKKNAALLNCGGEGLIVQKCLGCHRGGVQWCAWNCVGAHVPTLLAAGANLVPPYLHRPPNHLWTNPPFFNDVAVVLHGQLV